MAPMVGEIGMFRRPVFWAGFTTVTLACAIFAILNVPRAFSIVELDLQMDRVAALAEARGLSEQFGWGPSGYRQAASFRVDDQVRSFVELEAGGAETFAGSYARRSLLSLSMGCAPLSRRRSA